jgi:amidophosphoribosyltransferase
MLLTPIHEKCAVFGVYGEDLEAARLVHAGLWALQHRGQESSGISSSNGLSVRTHKGSGLVAHVYSEDNLQSLNGHIAIGHNRYATSGGGDTLHNQPVIREGELFALAHNGNLPVTKKLEAFLQGKHLDISKMNDSEMMYMSLSIYLKQGLSIEEAVTKAFPLFSGVFSLLIMTNNKLVAVRDICGIRPLAIGKLKKGYAFSSETCALNTIQAKYIREVKPGEMVVINEKGLHSHQIAKGKEKLDVFEFVYFSRPDSMLLGKNVNEVRKNMGKKLAEENKIKADIVIPVPDSAIPAALGYSEVSHIPFDHGFIKNRYIHRTFIRPAQNLRETDVEIKLNALSGVLKGKRVIIIDDSIVRGTTSKKIVTMVRRAGAKEVHLLISSPPVMYPDFYGINTPKQSDLLASEMSISDIKNYINADSVRFLSYKGMIEATGLPETTFTTSCFTGVYPIDIGEENNKNIKEVKVHKNERRTN